MTTIQNPHNVKDKIKTAVLMTYGLKLREMKLELREITEVIAINTVYSPFDKEVDELYDSIVVELGVRALQGKVK